MKRTSSGRHVLPVSLVFAVGFVFLSNAASAQNWTGEGDDNLWDNPDNWDILALPTLTDETRINAPGAEDNPPLIEDGIDAEVGILISDFGTTSMSMTGGTLTCGGWGTWWGDAAGTECTFYMSGGTVNYTGEPGIFEIGWQSAGDPPGSSIGIWEMTGGTINAKGVDMPGKGNGGIAEIDLYGGTLNVGTARGGLIMYPDQEAFIDITEGTLVLEGDELFKVEELIDREQIIAYGGEGEVEYDYDGVSTIVTAIAPTPPGGIQPGDFNTDGSVNVTDAVALLNHLFGGGDSPPCGDETLAHASNVTILDCNGDGQVNIADPVCALSFLFGGGAPPAAGTDCLPVPECPIVCRG